MSRSERCFNALLGMSVLSWAFLGLLATDEPSVTPVRLAITALHLCVGGLILFRGPLQEGGSIASCWASLPSLLIAGLAIRSAPLFHQWPLPSELLFLCGTMLALFGFISLGRSFAVLPALRSTVVRGPFRVIRHPAYLGELLMVVACCTAAPSWPALAVLAVAVPFCVLRIAAEERLLMSSPDYARYADRVRWRLIPQLW